MGLALGECQSDLLKILPKVVRKLWDCKGLLKDLLAEQLKRGNKVNESYKTSMQYLG